MDIFSKPYKNSAFDFMFKETEKPAFPWTDSYEEKRKKLAEEMKADYNVFLQTQENKLNRRRRSKENESMAQSTELPSEIEKSKEIFGKTGGGGEPIKDSLGNIITSRPHNVVSSIRNSNSISYAEELRKQIEEKKNREAQEKEFSRKLDERFSTRVEQQRKQMEEEFERDHSRISKINEEFKRQEKRLQMLQEFQKRDERSRTKRVVNHSPIEMNEKQETNIIISKVDRATSSIPQPIIEKRCQSTQTTNSAKIDFIRSQLLTNAKSSNNEEGLKNMCYKITSRRTVQPTNSDSESDDDFYDEPNKELKSSLPSGLGLENGNQMV